MIMVGLQYKKKKEEDTEPQYSSFVKEANLKNKNSVH